MRGEGRDARAEPPAVDGMREPGSYRDAQRGRAMQAPPRRPGCRAGCPPDVTGEAPSVSSSQFRPVLLPWLIRGQRLSLKGHYYNARTRHPLNPFGAKFSLLLIEMKSSGLFLHFENISGPKEGMGNTVV